MRYFSDIVYIIYSDFKSCISYVKHLICYISAKIRQKLQVQFCIHEEVILHKKKSKCVTVFHKIIYKKLAFYFVQKVLEVTVKKLIFHAIDLRYVFLDEKRSFKVNFTYKLENCKTTRDYTFSTENNTSTVIQLTNRNQRVEIIQSI